jgi:20S proteasome alpha/beta subunit
VPAIVTQVLAERVAGFVHAYTMYWSVRPFGVSVLIATKDSDGDSIWMVEPSGLTYRSVHTPQVLAGTYPEDLDEKVQAS